MIIQVDKIIAVSRDTNEKAAIFIGVFLGLSQCFRVDYVELDMISSEVEIGSYESPIFSRPPSPSRTEGRNRWFRRVPPDLTWFILLRDFTTAVGPRRSAP
jgi:hypothetical protein